ncbi:MAG: cobalt-precorrin-5B (C(1))-methyltransferase CbiD [Lachnospiraceae bacterium]|nr:cobalt-precorrin-5B (C(1))-methyltransferase CbiD [Lachnospiraceae bacterium]
MEQFVYKDNKKMRLGYTTGSCAAAAAKAAADMLLGGGESESVSLMTPKGMPLDLEVLAVRRSENSVTCAIRKDGGDDADATHGHLIEATVGFSNEDPAAYDDRWRQGNLILTGGPGVGRITKKGLEQAIGDPAINKVPRSMIFDNVRRVAAKYGCTRPLKIVISVPEGEAIAEKTFNPRLGILGGISILGTSGIVEPMSEEALVKTIHTEMAFRLADGRKHLLVAPGNYGRDFANDTWGIELDDCVKCSNFVGQTVDMAYEFRLEKMLFIGHIGKLVKIAAGVMNTHSRYADCRMEVLTAALIEAGGTLEMCRELLTCITTDDALASLEKWGMIEPVCAIVMKKIDTNLNRRAWEGLRIEVIMFSKEYGVLGKTAGADALLDLYRKDGAS